MKKREILDKIIDRIGGTSKCTTKDAKVAKTNNKRLTVNNSTSTGVNTEVIDTTLEVWYIWLHLWQSVWGKELANGLQNKSSNNAHHNQKLFR